jgi:hypothetical protein
LKNRYQSENYNAEIKHRTPRAEIQPECGDFPSAHDCNSQSPAG